MKPIPRSALAVALAVAVLPGAALAAALDLTPPAQVRATGAKNPTVAIDAKSGAVYLAWAQNKPVQPAPVLKDGKPKDLEVDAVVARSGDGGASFGSAHVVSAAQDNVRSAAVNPTRVEVGPNGSVYVLYSHTDKHFVKKELEGRTRNELRLVRSTDGGQSFSAPTAIGTEAGEGVLTSLGMTNLFVAPDGKLYASWLDTRETYAYIFKHGKFPPPDLYASQLRVARSIDGGKSFAPSTLAEGTTCVCCGTKVAQGRTGPLYASTRSSWHELAGSVDAVRDIFVARSQDAGQTWEKSAKVHDDQFKISACPDVTPGLEVDGRGALHAAWYTGSERHPGVFYAVSKDQGKTFSAPVTLLKDEWVPYADVKMALDRDGNAWVAFEDKRGDTDLIHLTRIGTDGSVTRATPWPGTIPDLAARADGAVVVTWGGLPQGEAEHAGDIYVRVARFVPDVGGKAKAAATGVQP